MDVALGAVVFSASIANMLQVSVPEIVYVELALAVWSIYTWDHLKDAASVDNPSTYRHLFHKIYAKELHIALLIALLLGAILIYYLPVQTVYMGIMLCVFVLLYFILIHFQNQFYHKELFIAVLYALGVFLGPYSCAVHPVNLISLSISFVMTLLIAFINLLMFSDFEKKSDIEDGHPSLAIVLGSKVKPLMIALFLSLTVILVNSFYLSLLPLNMVYCYGLMIAVLGGIYYTKKISLNHDYYRILGDGIFFIPLIFLV